MSRRRDARNHRLDQVVDLINDVAPGWVSHRDLADRLGYSYDHVLDLLRELETRGRVRHDRSAHNRQRLIWQAIAAKDVNHA